MAGAGFCLESNLPSPIMSTVPCEAGHSRECVRSWQPGTELLQKRCATFGTCGLGRYVVMDWHRCGLTLSQTFIALSHAHSHSHIIILPQSLPCCLFILCAHIATCVHAGCCYVYTMQPFDNHVVIAASAHTDVDPSLLVQVGRCEISQASPVHNLQEPRRDFPQ